MSRVIYEERKDVKEEKKEVLNKKAEDKKNKKLKIIFFTILTLIAIGLVAIDILLYGRNNKFRDWLITNAMTTMNHRYLATWFYTDEEINEVLSRNRVIEVDEDTNTDLITVGEIEEVTEYANEYERQVLEREEGQEYKIIEINEDSFDAYMAVIYDPSRISVATTNSLKYSGQYLVDIAKQNDALVAINGGGFSDSGGNGTGGTPLGITFSNGKFVYNYGGKNETFSLVGFNNENKLVLGKYTQTQALNNEIRDAVTFSPFLIVNGQASFVEGNGGWGVAPRTAIGQRQDGIVLFLVVDGRRITKQGAGMKDLVQIMQNYGAYNAANLDGGTSSTMVVENEIINDPMDASGNHRTRPIATSFIFK